MPVEDLQEDKTVEYQELIRKGTLDDNLVEAYPVIVIRAICVIGWTVLLIGSNIVIWIVFANQ